MDSKNQLTPTDTAEVVVPCIELDPTLSFFTSELGFRIEMITPADNPHTAIISGYGVRLCLQVGGSGENVTLQLHCVDRAPEILRAPNGTSIELILANQIINLPPLSESLVVSQFSSEASWTVGRAGMRYRDLIPSRLGGVFIASHIHIPNGGPVPDYVHYHRISFQMIYCKSGWVRVVYEDQGESFVMQAGDCVLQPPEIRHRVLESSDNLEVIEIGSPAEHETFAEHEITLPTSTLRPDRDFSGQRFVHHVARDSKWNALSTNLDVIDTGIFEATQGNFSAQIIRSSPKNGEIYLPASDKPCFVFVLTGTLVLVSETTKETLESGESLWIPASLKLKTILDGEILVVELF